MRMILTNCVSCYLAIQLLYHWALQLFCFPWIRYLTRNNCYLHYLFKSLSTFLMACYRRNCKTLFLMSTLSLYLHRSKKAFVIVIRVNYEYYLSFLKGILIFLPFPIWMILIFIHFNINTNNFNFNFEDTLLIP